VVSEKGLLVLEVQAQQAQEIVALEGQLVDVVVKCRTQTAAGRALSQT
jgi:hypothetical protein